MRRYAPGAASACLEATADDSMTILCRSVGGSEETKSVDVCETASGPLARGAEGKLLRFVWWRSLKKITFLDQ